MDRIVIIGANSFQNPLILKAKELGYKTHVFAWQDGSVGEKTADYFYPVSIVEKDRILEICRKIRPSAVVTIASDLAVITAAYIAEKLNLPGNSESCVKKSTNKFVMRRAFKKAGLLSPKFAEATEKNWREKIKEMNFPLIVKPTDRSGSRSITRVLKENQVEEAVRKAVLDSFENKAIIEEYIEGREYSLEAVSYRGRHTFLAVTKKYTTGAPNFIETGHIQPAYLLPETLEKIKRTVFTALDALEIENGASHSEFKIDSQGNIWIIEIGARMGGDCIGSHLVPLSTGYDFVKMVLDIGLGKAPDLTRGTAVNAAAIRFIMERKDLEQLKKLKREMPEKICAVSELEEIGSHRVIDSSSRYGYYITAWDRSEEIEKWLGLSEK